MNFSGVKLQIKLFFKAIFYKIFGDSRLKIKILRAFSRDYELSKKELENLIATPLNSDSPKGDFIATLTTFPARIGILKYALHSIFAQDLRAKKVILVLSKDEFILDSADSQNLDKKNPCVSTTEISPDSWCKKSESKDAVVPSADFLLESDKRGTPPKSEKAAAFWRVGGAGRGVQPFLRKETSEISVEGGVKSTKCAQLDNLLPDEILDFQKFGLEIMWVEKNLRVYNKFIHTLRAFPNEVIITIDDDIYYPRNLFSTLYTAHLSDKRAIWAHKARIVPFNSTKIQDFFEWKIIRKNNTKWQNKPKFNIYLEGCGGVLYPPHCLHKDAMDSEKFLRIAPNSDDLWLWAMAILNGTKIACVPNALMGNGAAFTNPASNPALWHSNMCGGNDKAIKALLESYPQILKILNGESKCQNKKSK